MESNPALSEITETLNNLSLLEENSSKITHQLFAVENQPRDPETSVTTTTTNSQNQNQNQNQKKPPLLPPLLSTPKSRKTPTTTMVREQHLNQSSISNLRLPDLSSRRRSTADNPNFLSTSTSINSLNMDAHNTSQSVDRDFLAQFEKIKITPEITEENIGLLDDPTQDTTVIEDDDNEDGEGTPRMTASRLLSGRGHIKKPIRKIFSTSSNTNLKAKENSLAFSALGSSLKHHSTTTSSSLKGSSMMMSISPMNNSTVDGELLRQISSSFTCDLRDDVSSHLQLNDWSSRTLRNYGGGKKRGIPFRKCWLCKCIFSSLKPNKIMLPPISRQVQKKNPLTGEVSSINRLVSPCICSPYCLLIYYENNPQLKINTPSYLGSSSSSGPTYYYTHGDLLDEFFP